MIKIGLIMFPEMDYNSSIMFMSTSLLSNEIHSYSYLVINFMQIKEIL
jgi:hypothetical protein